MYEEDIIVEEQVAGAFVDTNEATAESKVGLIFYKVARWCILTLVFLLPVWFLPTTISPVFANKMFLVSFLTILSLLCYVIYAILRGRIEMPFHWLFVLVGVVLAVWIVSSLASSQTILSFLGATGYEGNSALSIFIFFILLGLIATLFSDTQSQLQLFTALGIGFILFLFSMIFFVSGFGKLFGSDFASSTFNTIGSWRSAAFALGFFTMLLYPFLLTARGKLRWALSMLFILNLIAIFIVNSPLVWAIIGIFAILFLSYSIWQRSVSAIALGVSLILLLASIFGFFSQDAIASILKLQVPVEVNVSYRATFDISKEVLQDHLLFGNGPTSFIYSWDALKPTDVNQTAFWNTRFVSGSSFLLTMLSEVGLIGFLGFAFLLLIIWYFVLRNLTAIADENQVFALSAFLLVSYTILMWVFYPANYTLMALGFVALGIGLAALKSSGMIRTLEIRLFREGPAGFIFSLFLVFVMLVSASGIYLIGSRYIGQIMFSRGVFAFNNAGNIASAEANILRAYGFDRWNSLYPRSLGQINLVKAKTFIQNNSNTQNLLGSQFKTMLDNSIRLHQEAINLAPRDFENYQAFGKVYEFLVTIGVDGARVGATSQYDKAIEHSPKNPVLWHDKASVIIADVLRTRDIALLKQAEEALIKAIELKPDYTEAHFLLAQVFDAEGNLPEAIKRAEAAALLAPNDIGSLFQLGLLYYKSDRLSDSETIFNVALKSNTDYSNARYFLGLIYDRTNRRGAAIEQFEKIQALNPGNQEVAMILSNLRSGRGALTSILSPPDKRNTPPVK